MHIYRRLALGSVAIALAVMTQSCSGDADRKDRLTAYGKQIASSSEQNTIFFITVIKTTETPRRAYQIKFKTDHQSMMAERNAEKDRKAYLINQGKVRMWTAKFCTPELKKTMEEFGIDLVSGNLTNLEGEVQSMDLCNKD